MQISLKIYGHIIIAMRKCTRIYRTAILWYLQNNSIHYTTLYTKWASGRDTNTEEQLHVRRTKFNSKTALVQL
jgi:hypothetical protein